MLYIGSYIQLIHGFLEKKLGRWGSVCAYCWYPDKTLWYVCKWFLELVQKIILH